MKRREAIKKAAWMSGIALSAPSMVAALQGCSADRSLDWEPAFFTNDEAVLVADLAETILPRTEGSPGAKDIMVDRFIDDMLANYTGEEMGNEMREGLKSFQDACQEANGNAFSDLDPDARLAYLNEVNRMAISGDEGNPFPQFLGLKQAVFTGYFTSEEVGENVLAYDPIPGGWEPCTDLESGPSGGKAWSL